MATYREAIDAAVARAAEAGEGGEVYRHVAELLALFGRRFEAVKERRGGLDFEDLQLRAVRLLEREEVGDAYRSRFSHLLVDEFQDTNRLQLRLIEALRGPRTELMVVGDELQSIYGFRHADLDVFRERRRAVEAGGDAVAIELSGNFRSRPEVIGAVNAIGGKLLGDAFHPLRVGAPPATASPPGDGARGRAAADRPRRLGRGGDRPGVGDRRRHAAGPSRRGALRRRAAAAAARERGRARRDGRPAARLHPPRRLRGLARPRRPAPLRRSAAAATGPSSRSPTSARCWRRSPTRSTTRRCSARSPRPPAASRPTRSGCCAPPPAAAGTSGRRWSWRRELARRSWRTPSGLTGSRRPSWRWWATSHGPSPACASGPAGSRWPS